MKKQVGVWIDTSKSVIVHLNESSETTLEIMSDIENRVHHFSEGDKGSFKGNLHISNEKKFEERKKNQTQKYLDVVFDNIKDADSIFIFGPAEMKFKLESCIKKDKKTQNKIIALRPCEAMSNKQIVAITKDFFLSNENIDL